MIVSKADVKIRIIRRWSWTRLKMVDIRQVWLDEVGYDYASYCGGCDVIDLSRWVDL